MSTRNLPTGLLPVVVSEFSAASMTAFVDLLLRPFPGEQVAISCWRGILLSSERRRSTVIPAGLPARGDRWRALAYLPRDDYHSCRKKYLRYQSEGHPSPR